jgi:hypothetical protein
VGAAYEVGASRRGDGAALDVVAFLNPRSRAMRRLRETSATALHNTLSSLARSALHCLRGSFSHSMLAASDSTVFVGADRRAYVIAQRSGNHIGIAARRDLRITGEAQAVSGGNQGHHQVQRRYAVRHDELDIHRARHALDLPPEALADFRMAKHQRIPQHLVERDASTSRSSWRHCASNAEIRG